MPQIESDKQQRAKKKMVHKKKMEPKRTILKAEEKRLNQKEAKTKEEAAVG